MKEEERRISCNRKKINSSSADNVIYFLPLVAKERKDNKEGNHPTTPKRLLVGKKT
ncbi:MAG: hypothetical protein IKY31_03390 [Bacteroidaceae bacterium]|nr:hypothetical protein [Bacteroidaceae bacterium]